MASLKSHAAVKMGILHAVYGTRLEFESYGFTAAEKYHCCLSRVGSALLSALGDSVLSSRTVVLPVFDFGRHSRARCNIVNGY